MTSELDTIAIPGDGITYINNGVFDEAMRVLKPSTFTLLCLLLTKTRNSEQLEVRCSIAALGIHQERHVLAPNSVMTGLRELRGLGIVTVDEAPTGSTATHTYRLCAVNEWNHEAIGDLLRAHRKVRDARSIVRNDKQWPTLRRHVLERDHYTCQYCGQQDDDLHCDHVIPVARGGTNDLSNLVTACARCNLSKGDKTADEWAR